MKILKTSQRAREINASQAAALREMRRCPECGHWNEYISQGLTADLKPVYRAECSYCGCEWESAEFEW